MKDCSTPVTLFRDGDGRWRLKQRTGYPDTVHNIGVLGAKWFRARSSEPAYVGGRFVRLGQISGPDDDMKLSLTNAEAGKEASTRVIAETNGNGATNMIALPAISRETLESAGEANCLFAHAPVVASLPSIDSSDHDYCPAGRGEGVIRHD